MTQSPYHHGNLRQALLEAGEKLLETVGVEALSLRALSRETGVSHTAPYRHFVDKAELLAALAAVGFTRLADALGEVDAAYPDDPEQRYLAACHRYIELGRGHPAMYRLMFGQRQPGVGGQPELALAGHAAFSGLVAAMAQGQEVGIFRPGPVESLAMAVWAMVHGLTELAISGRLDPCCETEGDATRLSEAACTLLLQGLRSNPSGI